MVILIYISMSTKAAIDNEDEHDRARVCWADKNNMGWISSCSYRKYIVYSNKRLIWYTKTAVHSGMI
jgi:hypothetical protein